MLTPTRTRLAIAGARLAAATSRRFGLGNGGMIGGRVALKLDPRALSRLGRDRTVVLITGTNGKTTTALMLSRILQTLGPVALNADGANMPDGVLAALATNPLAPLAVLEVDENYVSAVADELRPACLVLLNLSRDQLDRMGEVRATERELRAVVSRLPSTTVVANCDDPLVTSAALAAARQVWVGAGQSWHADALACARCGQAILRDGTDWQCVCGFTRPAPLWTLDGDDLTTPGSSLPLDLQLPGRANAANAAMAVATAVHLGVPAETAIERVRSISAVAGRYRRAPVAGHSVRLLLAKNPAGWRETLPLLDSHTPVVIAVNSREADGRDMSWLWDVPFERLAGRPVVAAGERAMDLAVRLTYAEVPHTVARDPIAAVAALDGESVELVANYTAFRGVAQRMADE
ncbi:MurT ligase domain-containing protein [Amycolatopsis sp. GM8]|uniref:MurT ligase domain-containing protein n=1 Tax=Amycolatopsis sp. GM8 TaxID=2896530 RepID=UPI001F2820AB|nr:MurT ligase domain-containing protein [Amycolatopsis sp. GM8]